MSRLLLLVLCACGAVSPVPETPAADAPEPPAPNPTYETTRLERSPSPFPGAPHRGSWTPDPRLPAELVAIVRRLFDELGAPDPRGLETRRVALRIGTVWGSEDSVETIGWLLPGEPVDGRRFVIALDGLIYAAEGVGDAVTARPSHAEAPPEIDGSPSPQSFLAAALFARAGNVDEALAAWTSLTSETERAPPTPSAVASGWLWLRIERGYCAHMRGDDPLALHDATRAQALLPQVPSGRGQDTWPSMVEALLRDQRRRSEEGEVRMPRAPGAETQAEVDSAERDPAVRVAELVRELDQVSARQMMQPGGVMLTMDPIVEELIALGDAAVEPMLTVLETDQRLTRSVHFWRDFARSRTILGVHEAAYTVLANILETDFFRASATGDNLTLHGMEGRRATAARIRAYWQRFRAMPEHERWYVLLQDDDPQRWAPAALTIVMPESQRATRSMGIRFVREDDANQRLRGEPLRDRRRPSVTELLGRRLRDLRAAPITNAINLSCDVATAARRWDPRGSRRALRQHLEACFEEDCPCTAELVEALAEERGVLARYARWIQSANIEAYRFPFALRPFRGNEDHPSLQGVLSRLLEKPERRDAALREPREILDLAAGRQLLLRELGRTNVVGEIHVEDDDGRFSFSYQTSASSGGGGGSYANNDAEPAGTEMPLRQCDLIARDLAAPLGPPFQLNWSVPRRDQALAAMRAWLEAGAPRTGSNEAESP